MAVYFRKFEKISDYEAFKNSEDWITPNISKIMEDDSIIYNEKEIIVKNYLRFTALEDSTISLTNKSSNTPNVEYSFDGINDWTTWDYSAINLPSGTTVYMKGNNPNGFSGSSSKYSTFVMTGKIESHGNIMSLLYYDEFEDKLTIPSSNCYRYMFKGCTSLTTAPELPATTLAGSCYSGMFTSCVLLTTAPKLPATTLAYGCYLSMFNSCTSLTTIPELPATTLVEYCYYGMFSGCSSLTTAPELPATTLADYCYQSMFQNCKLLTTAPELPATTLANSCYEYMFNSCRSLTTAPSILPATTLANYCYQSMFKNCTSLTTSPELPSTTLASNCYSNMFSGCSSLNNITMLAMDISASNCLSNWVSGVATNGTFTKNANMTSLTSGVNGIPNGWTVMNYGEIDYSTQYLTIESLENDNQVSFGSDVMCSVNDGEWYELTVGNNITINQGEYIKFKGELVAQGCAGMGTFSATKQYNVKGNIMSLLCGDEFIGETDLSSFGESILSNLFRNSTTLIDASNLILPATTLTNHCYQYMFSGCESLTTAPELPATTLVESCYTSMFYGCSSLTTAPELPATTLASNCYSYMFKGCSSLNSITMLATDISAYECLYNWTSNVASTGTFTKAANMTSLPNGINGIPNGWTVQNYYYYFPSIHNTLSEPIDFNYNEGMFTPTVTVELTKIMSEENILSLQPMCDITVNVINKDNSLHTSDYLWINAKTLSDVMKELNISDINDIAIVIVDAEIPEDSGYYYYDVEIDYSTQYLTIESLENDNQVSFSNDIMYSNDGITWDILTNGESLLLNSGDEVKFKLNNPTVSLYGFGSFSVTKQYNVSGNIMSLLYGDEFIGKTDLSDFGNYALSQLFYMSTTLVDASNLILPATTLAGSCYENMFQGCTSLTTAPELPATTLAGSCYSGMFMNCTSLTASPELPATTLAGSCYSGMFQGCTSLTTAPELPATTLASNCYHYMFNGCSSLNTAPELPATTLAIGCYSSMFSGCSSLTTVPELSATTLATACYSSMFSGCTSLTTATELPATILANGCYSRMFQNCKLLTTAPSILPATTLASSCYEYMFGGCSKLNNITMLATNISAYDCLFNWVNGVASTGTFTKSLSMTSLPTGNSGIPKGWTVENYNG